MLTSRKVVGMVAVAALGMAVVPDHTAGAQGTVQEHESSAPLASTLLYSGELVADVAGGAHRGSVYSGLAAVEVKLRLEELVGWRGARGFVLLVGTHGGAASALVGDVQGVADLEAPPGINVAEAWLQQNLLGNRISLLAGRYDVSTEFDFTRSGSLFLNNSLGIGPEFALSGIRGPSIYPFTTTGARLAVKATRNAVVRLAMLADALRVGEVALLSRKDTMPPRELPRYEIGRGVTQSYSGKLAVGGWYYGLRLPDLADTLADGAPMHRHGSGGVYLVADQTLWRAPGDKPGALMAFLQLGLGDPRVNQVGRYVGGGFAMTAPFKSRAEDEAGIAFAAALNGSHFVRAQSAKGIGTVSEVALEATYFVQAAPWLAVQPDVQLVLNPGGTRATPDALVFGLQITLSYDYELVRSGKRRLTRRAAAPTPLGRSRTGASSPPARR